MLYLECVNFWCNFLFHFLFHFLPLNHFSFWNARRNRLRLVFHVCYIHVHYVMKKEKNKEPYHISGNSSWSTNEQSNYHLTHLYFLYWCRLSPCFGLHGISSGCCIYMNIHILVRSHYCVSFITIFLILTDTFIVGTHKGLCFFFAFFCTNISY